MRETLRSAFTDIRPEHVGLSYNTWAPIEAGGKVSDEKRLQWLSQLARCPSPQDYTSAFQRWKSSFQTIGDRTFELQLNSRLLVGHGNASATDVGLTLHHTWSVPIIPGSALKGLLAHYVDAVYAPENRDLQPWQQPESERQYVCWQGSAWNHRRIIRGPGECYRELFGAPEAEADEDMRKHGIKAGSTAGRVSFHDALYVPGSVESNCPLAIDVVTVHQKTYYDKKGATWPNDYESPNPVGFLTVRPGIRMLFALSGPAYWTDLAEKLLTDALREWGVGGKTSSGYGRLTRPVGTSDSDRASKRQRLHRDIGLMSLRPACITRVGREMTNDGRPLQGYRGRLKRPSRAATLDHQPKSSSIAETR